jgi:hypothetical protein
MVELEDNDVTTAGGATTQSLKDLAVRSPATVARVDPDTAGLKIPAYDAMWSGAKPI